MQFKAIRIHNDKKQIFGQYDNIHLEDLNAADTVINAHWSCVNYKDYLAVTGKGKIARRYPMVAGIDAAGVVESSTNPDFKPGTRVLINGSGMSETKDGCYAQYIRADSAELVRVPENLSLREAMVIGTAGFTAAMAYTTMTHNGQHPERGPILINGASGGVGSFAIDLFNRNGYEVHAVTTHLDSTGYLQEMGASEITLLDAIDYTDLPLAKAIWGGAVDNLGGDQLAWLTRTVKPNGNIASIGLVAGIELSTTVMPFILRGINLLGINSVYMPIIKRQAIWDNIASGLRPKNIDKFISEEIPLKDLLKYFDETKPAIPGRVLVNIIDGAN